MQGVMTSCLQKCKTNLSKMKKLARITTHHTIRSSQPKAEMLSHRASHILGLVRILDGWLFGFRKNSPVWVDSIKGGARPAGREIQNKY